MKANSSSVDLVLISAVIVLILFGGAATAQTQRLHSNGKIAFTSDRDGNREIYVMNGDGSGQVRLTNNALIDQIPAFSPDGRKIAYVSQLSVSSVAAKIKIMNADGTNQTELTSVKIGFSPDWQEYGGSSLSWSPDGSKIAFDDDGEIFTINIDGTDRTNLTNHPATDIAPAWSPDGSRILFDSSRFGYSSMHLMNADGSNVITLPGSYFDESPAWSPSGDKIAFVLESEDFQPILYTADADGTNRRAFDAGNSAQRNKPRWSPDATKIVFQKLNFSGFDCEIYVKNVNGGGLTQLTDTFGNNGQPSWQPLPRSVMADFDGDGRADISVFRPSDSVWYLNQSTAGFSATQFGLATDKIVPADYDGDGKTDIAVYRDGVWYWLKSSNGTVRFVQFGLASDSSIPGLAGGSPIPGLVGDIPIPADYTGDGQAELAVYRGGTWWTLDLSNNQVSVNQFGLVGDELVVGDYDGDGRADQAVYRSGEWHLNRSSQGYTVVNFGLASDKPVPADYDGDGRTDPAVYRDGTWYLLRSTDGFTAFQFGLATDILVPGDYDGDGRADISVWRPSTGVWYSQRSTSGFTATRFGLLGDKPVGASYVPVQ